MRLFGTSILVLFAIVMFASCDASKSTADNATTNSDANDTIRIKNDSLEYEIIIIEPGFYNWLATQQPRGYYGQAFLEARNMMWVMEYNRRVLNPQQFDPNLYLQRIDYEPGIDYGYEVNYLLYNYLKYFQRRYDQRLPGSRI